MMFNPTEMRRRFHELRKKRDAIREKSGSLRSIRDGIEQKARASVATIDAQIRDAEKGLPEIKEEMAFICRGLGGKTGKPD